MTMAMYARRKKWPLERVIVRLRHSRVHAEDCAACETQNSRLTVTHVEDVARIVWIRIPPCIDEHQPGTAPDTRDHTTL